MAGLLIDWQLPSVFTETRLAGASEQSADLYTEIVQDDAPSHWYSIDTDPLAGDDIFWQDPTRTEPEISFSLGSQPFDPGLNDV